MNENGVMESVFVVQHLHLIEKDREDVKLIGVYRSAAAARAAVDRLKTQPGFCDHPNIIDPLVDHAIEGFYIDEYRLDEDNWAEGFVTERWSE